MQYIKIPYADCLTCSTCGITNAERYVHLARPGNVGSGTISSEPICGPCFRERSEREGRRLHDEVSDLNGWVHENLRAIGMSNIEVKAELSLIPQQLLSIIPDEILKPMYSGVTPRAQGLGLAGIPGSGKTSATAALVRQMLAANAANRNPFQELVPPRNLLWWNWPTLCHRWRLDALDGKIAKDIKRAMAVRLLVIDDLGRETKRRESSEDVATGHLDAVITQRDRDGLITLWTSNLTEEELIARYGTGMIRRLLRLNPAVWLEGADIHPNAL